MLLYTTLIRIFYLFSLSCPSPIPYCHENWDLTSTEASSNLPCVLSNFDSPFSCIVFETITDDLCRAEKDVRFCSSTDNPKFYDERRFAAENRRLIALN